MNSICLGTDAATGQPFYLPLAAFATHVHCPGTTGTGKTTLIRTMLHQLLRDRRAPACHIIFDFLGGLSWDLLLWMVSPYCPAHVRARLVYVEPARTSGIVGINPLVFDDPDNGFYKVSRATELVLRAWDSQAIQEMPRLARWLFNSFWACAWLRLTIADTQHLLLPGSPYHKPLLDALPERLKHEWQSLLTARGAEAERILESSRNRLKPFYESTILRRIFGSTSNRLDVFRLMREGRIVLLNLAPAGRVAPQEANAIAGLVLNEVLAAARSLPMLQRGRYPTYLWLDEFQRMTTKDVELAVPEVRQLGLRLILAHQTFGQLVKPDFDLTPMIFLPRTRFAFALAGEDADLLAHEFASLTFDPMKIKDEVYSTRQLEVGKRLVELESWGTTCTDARSWQQAFGQSWTRHAGLSRRDGSVEEVHSDGRGSSESTSRGEGSSRSHGSSHTTHQQLVGELHTFLERASTTYSSFEEQRQLWAREVRRLQTGTMIAWLANDPQLRTIRVAESRPGRLRLSPAVLEQRLPRTIEAVEQLIEQSLRSEWFVSPQVIDRETQERLERILRPVIAVSTKALEAPARQPALPAPASANDNPLA